MKKLTQMLTLAAVAVVMCLGTSKLTAQDNPPAGGDRPRRGGGEGGQGGGNFDPAQMQQRMMERYKERLEITNDEEWKAMEPLVQKVMTARMQSVAGMGRGMFGGRGGGGGGGQDGGGQRRGGFGGEPSPEAEALQKAIDSKASASELKAAMAKYEESRKVKQAELEKAQANLRKVLTVRQEALATVNGLL